MCTQIAQLCVPILILSNWQHSLKCNTISAANWGDIVTCLVHHLSMDEDVVIAACGLHTDTDRTLKDTCIKTRNQSSALEASPYPYPSPCDAQGSNRAPFKVNFTHLTNAQLAIMEYPPMQKRVALLPQLYRKKTIKYWSTVKQGNLIFDVLGVLTLVILLILRNKNWLLCSLVHA